MLKKITMMSACVASAFAMHTGEININDRDLEVSALFDIGQFNQNVEPDTMFIGGKFLNADKEHSSKEYRDIDPYFEVNFLMQREIKQSGLSFGLGIKANYTKDYSALPLGVLASYEIPAVDLIPMYLYGSVYYAPQALAFSDAKNFLEYRIGYDIEVIKNGRITLGYRSLDTNYDDYRGDYNYNKSWYLGFKIGF